MLPYPIQIDFHQRNPSTERCLKIKKLRRYNQRTTRRSLKKEFEKLLVPTFASKIARNYSDSMKNKLGCLAKPKKPPKVLPDNLADFIIDNESNEAGIPEDDYIKCMDILMNTKNRKNQIIQICQILNIDKESIRKKRKSRTHSNSTCSCDKKSVIRKRKSNSTPNCQALNINPLLDKRNANDLSADNEQILERNCTNDSYADSEKSEMQGFTPLNNTEIYVCNKNADLLLPKFEKCVLACTNPCSKDNACSSKNSEIGYWPPAEYTDCTFSDVDDCESADLTLCQMVEEPCFQQELNSIAFRSSTPANVFLQTISKSFAATVASYACMFIGT